MTIHSAPVTPQNNLHYFNTPLNQKVRILPNSAPDRLEKSKCKLNNNTSSKTNKPLIVSYNQLVQQALFGSSTTPSEKINENLKETPFSFDNSCKTKITIFILKRLNLAGNLPFSIELTVRGQSKISWCPSRPSILAIGYNSTSFSRLKLINSETGQMATTQKIFTPLINLFWSNTGDLISNHSSPIANAKLKQWNFSVINKALLEELEPSYYITLNTQELHLGLPFNKNYLVMINTILPKLLSFQEEDKQTNPHVKKEVIKEPIFSPLPNKSKIKHLR